LPPCTIKSIFILLLFSENSPIDGFVREQSALLMNVKAAACYVSMVVSCGGIGIAVGVGLDGMNRKTVT
jgi:hypothetical protein